MSDIDPGALVRLSDDLQGQLALVRDLIGTFLEEAPPMVARIEAGIAGGQAAEVMRAAHSLKSGCAMVGAERMRSLAVELENLGRAGDLASARRLMPEMRKQWASVERYLRSWNGPGAPA